MTALYVLSGVFVGTALGYLLAAFTAAAKHADMCHECRQEQVREAFDAVDAWEGTDD